MTFSQGIYAIVDHTANSVVGGLFLHSHEASAVRFFSDVASDQQTLVGRHVADHSLVCLGHIDMETGLITATIPHTVITGQSWAAARITE